MREVKAALARMGLYYLLLAINIIPCALIPDSFPTRNLSTIYLLLLSLCLVLYYAHRVSPTGVLSLTMKTLSWMAFLLIFLRGIKYSVFSEVDVLARHTWYLYYVPMLLLPLFLFHIALLIPPKKHPRSVSVWVPTLMLTIVLIGLVLTNDLHQLVFRFQPGFRDWDHTYSHGWLFYLVGVWQYALYLAAIFLLVFKCRVSSAKKNAWLLLIPFVIGITMNILLLTRTMPRLNGTYIVEFPEALICMAAVVLEGCMQLGLIPTNANYGKLFSLFSISAQITDRAGTPVYASRGALPLTPAQFALPDRSRIEAHTLLHKMPLPGGFGFWQDDMTELDRLNDQLAEAKEALQQEADLIRLRSALKERQAKIEQRTLVYDTIARRTRKQAQLISELAKAARLSPDAARKETCRSRITLLGAYIKRYANLMLLSQESGVVTAGDLGLSVSEYLRYLNFCGIPGEVICSADSMIPADAALAVFEAVEALLEQNLEGLQGVFINLSGQENVTLKLTLEHLTSPLPDAAAQALLRDGVTCEVQQEDDVCYLCFGLPKGGTRA